jgi:hypothetical protein
MNDVKDLLERALNDGPSANLATSPAMDPTADLLRGRAKLRKRRTAGFAGAAAIALGLGIVPFALSNTGTAPGAVQAQSTQTPAEVQSLPTIELAAYTGKQVPGYKVAIMPKGWVIQGGNSTSLTIAPARAKNKNPSFFVGKLMVGLVWHGFKPPTAADAKRNGETSQPVAGRPGWLSVEPDKESAADAKSRQAKMARGPKSHRWAYDPTMYLTYKGADGRWVYIQAPKAVGWTGADLARFAAGVTVLKNAAKSY